MSEVADAGPVCTEKQKAYVAGISDENLRYMLLHHVRLSDLLQEDRDKACRRADKYEKQVTEMRVKLIECCEIIGIKTD